MAEFLHEMVRKRERNNYERPLWLRTAYEDMARHMQESYQRMSVDMRAQEAIDRYMSQGASTPNVGMTMNMPMLDINAPADASLATRLITYVFTGEATQGYRGWVRAV